MKQEKAKASLGDQLTTLLQNPLIFEKFVENLQLLDLVRCSEVNQFWCVFFREYIYKYRNCNIRLDWFDSPCLQLKEFNDFITSSTFLLPFNGISTLDWAIKRIDESSPYKTIRTQICMKENHANLNSSESKAQLYFMVLRNVRFKYLPTYESTNSYPECPMNGFLREALVTHADQLETILCQTEAGTETNFRESSKNALEYFNVNPRLKLCLLPKVTTINICSPNVDDSTFAFCLYQLIKFCPNLKSIDGRIPQEFFEDRPPKPWPNWVIPKASLKCITQVFHLNEEQFWRLAREKPKLKIVDLYTCYYKPIDRTEPYDSDYQVNVPLVNYLLHENCLNSLKMLKCAMEQLVTISQEVRNWSLRSVSTLEIHGFHCTELEYLKFINLNRMFPQVTDLHLWPIFSRNRSTGRLYLIPALRSIKYEPFQYSDSTVRNLHIFWASIPPDDLQIIAQTLPNITNLSYHSCEEVEKMFKSLWQMNWPELQTIKFCSVQFILDIDHIIFGLNPEERDYIENQPDFHVGQYQSACSNYSVFNLKCLRKIQFEMEHCNCDFPRRDVRFLRTPFISPITVQRISKQFPSGFTLEMEIEPTCLRPDEQPLSETLGLTIKNQGLGHTSCAHKYVPFHQNTHGRCYLKKSKYFFIFNNQV